MPALLDLILEHKIDLVIDTPENGELREPRDGFLIRRYAIETGSLRQVLRIKPMHLYQA